MTNDEGSSSPPLPRVTVSHPMTQSASRARGHGAGVDTRSQASSQASLAFLTILRAQFRLSLKWFITLSGFLVGVALALLFVDRLGTQKLVGVPVAWWILGALCFPVLGLLAFRYVRKVERLERRYLALTERS
jgi:putative solute:sodium symporter small subunit